MAAAVAQVVVLVIGLFDCWTEVVVQEADYCSCSCYSDAHEMKKSTHRSKSKNNTTRHCCLSSGELVERDKEQLFVIRS